MAHDRAAARNDECAPIHIVSELHIPEAELNRRRANDERQDEYNRRSFGLAIASFIVTVLTLGAVGYYAWVAKRQWREMVNATTQAKIAADAATAQSRTATDTLKETRDFNRLSLRAWVAFKELKGPRPRVGETLYTIDFENVGRLPALNLTKLNADPIIVSRGDKPSDKLRIVPPREGTKGQSMLGAGNWTPVLFRVKLNEAQFQAVENGQSLIYLIVFINYTDPLATEGETKFCTYYDTRLVGGEWNACDNLNIIR
jgi:hypothetical protein